MNRNYRNYCRRLGEAMPLRSIFPRSALSNDDLIHIYQTAQTTDMDALRQAAAELFPERFQDQSPHAGLSEQKQVIRETAPQVSWTKGPQHEQVLPSAQDMAEDHRSGCAGMADGMICQY